MSGAQPKGWGHKAGTGLFALLGMSSPIANMWDAVAKGKDFSKPTGGLIKIKRPNIDLTKSLDSWANLNKTGALKTRRRPDMGVSIQQMRNLMKVASKRRPNVGVNTQQMRNLMKVAALRGSGMGSAAGRAAGNALGKVLGKAFKDIAAAGATKATPLKDALIDIFSPRGLASTAAASFITPIGTAAAERYVLPYLAKPKSGLAQYLNKDMAMGALALTGLAGLGVTTAGLAGSMFDKVSDSIKRRMAYSQMFEQFPELKEVPKDKVDGYWGILEQFSPK
ncbi:hypothetical protein EOM57_04665, partial [Candidatus Saccharibacteria bacterium]|nr:hypothetical protein [Candidatus Saccharibacteria bacterium]